MREIDYKDKNKERVIQAQVEVLDDYRITIRSLNEKIRRLEAILNSHKERKMEDCPFKLNDRVIWDNGYSYELGYFLGVGNHDNTYSVDKVTGNAVGRVASHSSVCVLPYSEEKINDLMIKYGVEKRFSDLFWTY